MSEYSIEQVDHLPAEIETLVHDGHVQDEAKNGIICNYKKFAFTAKNNSNKIIAALSGYTAFAEIYVDDIWVAPKCRKNGLGKKLLEKLEDNFRGKGYNNINLVTSHFQAPDFYKKCGFTVEFIRINKKNPNLSKTFFIKYLDDEIQHQGILEKAP